MKRWLAALGSGIVIVGLVGGGCGLNGWKWMKAVLNNRPEEAAKYLPGVKWCGNGLPGVENLEGMVTNKTYMVLLQNNTELRATGGFAGSYVKLQFGQGVLQKMEVEDIYQPDGQLSGHVEPPYPIQEAFGQGWWKLRDANWDVDFASAAAAVKWFMKEGGEKQVDGIVAVNLEVFKKWLDILGGVKTFTYDTIVTGDNLYELAQAEAEMNWKPGSTQKRDFLGAVGTAMWEETKRTGVRKILLLSRLGWQELKAGQIVGWFADERLQQIGEEKEWAGRVVRKANNYIYVVESNLGANKANCCIERKMELSAVEGEEVSQEIVLRWKNNNPFENPQPPESWGGNYIDYVRVVIPKEAVSVRVSVRGKELRIATEGDFAMPNSLRQGRSEEIFKVEERGEVQILGFWAVVKAGEETEAKISYRYDKGEQRYEVQVVRQPGIEGWPLKITWGKELVFEGWLQEKERIFVGH